VPVLGVFRAFHYRVRAGGGGDGEDPRSEGMRSCSELRTCTRKRNKRIKGFLARKLCDSETTVLCSGIENQLEAGQPNPDTDHPPPLP